MKIIQLKTAQKDKPLIELLREKGIDVPAYCGGRGTCGKCKVKVFSKTPEPLPVEKNRLTKEELAAGWRLACKAVLTGDIEVGIPETGIDEMLIEAEYHLERQEKVTHEKNDEVTVRNLTTGDIRTRNCAAIDIGTTTLAAAQIDPFTGKVIGTATSVNHQREYGADVISRIQAANQGKAEVMHNLIVEDIHSLLKKLGMSMEETRLIVSCNTTMGHLLQGLSCETLGKAPYKPVDISCHFYENMLLLPGISTFVGADIVSGIVSCGMDQKEQISLLVDVGTNGEIALGNKERILVTSAAAGPVFEGGNITCGVPAVPGAIASVELKQGGEEVCACSIE